VDSWVVGAVCDPTTAATDDGPVVQGAKGVDGGGVLMVGDYPGWASTPPV
jgi:phosphoribosylformylglycinamidine cyclo-ligase